MQRSTFGLAARVSARVHIVLLVAALVSALPLVADAATRFVADTGTDGPNCGVTAATACRSISQAIALATPGDTILVGPGRYGDLNGNSVLGDIPGEEIGSPGCSCVLSMNKNLIILSSAGAAVTIVDGRSMNVVQTVVVLSVGGEFGRPGKGFTVTETGRTDSLGIFSGHGIGINAADVKVRGNQVIFSRYRSRTNGRGIFTVNSAAILIEGNHVANWNGGIYAFVGGAVTVSKNLVTGNAAGIWVPGGKIVGNVALGNLDGIAAAGDTAVSGNAVSMNANGFLISDDGPGFTGVFTKNNMFGNVCGVSNSVVGFEATNNYWGAATGPGAPPAENVCNVVGGTTTTSPFATTPFKVKILNP